MLGFSSSPGLLIPTVVAQAIAGPRGATLGEWLTLATIPALKAAYQTLFVRDGIRPTPGREAKRIAIVDASSGQRLSFARAYVALRLAYRKADRGHRHLRTDRRNPPSPPPQFDEPRGKWSIARGRMQGERHGIGHICRAWQ